MRRTWIVLVTVLLAVLAGTAGTAEISEVSAAPATRAGVPAYCSADSPDYRYVVLFTPDAPRYAVSVQTRLACGTLRAYYPQLGVAIADSADAAFADRAGTDRAYSAQRDLAEHGTAFAARTTPAQQPQRAEPVRARAGEDLSGLQWDMDQIHAKQANRISTGSRRVLVGVLDSGVEASHPDLARAFDAPDSAGCLGGVTDTRPGASQPTASPHGTHVAGTIAAAADGHGITGVAPGVRLASVKVGNDDGLILPEAAVCGFVWAGRHHFTVTNSSYYVDPGMYFCPGQRGDAVAYEAVRRAVAYAQDRNVLVVASAGNSGSDVGHPKTDPNRDHPVDSSCRALPAGLPGVVPVSATGYQRTKAGYSSWGIVDVTAPGGDGDQVPPVEAGPACPVSTVPGHGYGSLCGTSMASPHATGVAALLAGTHPGASAAELRRLLLAQADPLRCPDNDSDCAGTPRGTNYYGHGLIDALRAVTR